MSARRPSRGMVIRPERRPRGPARDTLDPLSRRQLTGSGRWRPDSPFRRRGGIKVTMRAEPGLTSRKVLRVPFRFQCPPINNFERTWENDWQTFETVSDDEHARPGVRRLRRWPIETMFVDEDHAFLVWRGSFDPQRMLDELVRIQEAEEPFRLVCHHETWGSNRLINSVAVLTSIKATEPPGQVGTEYTNVEFLQIRPQRAGRRRMPRQRERTHRLAKGDTLHRIARRHLGAASKWRQIANANGIKGVDPGSAEELARWADRHNRRELKVPEG